MPRCFPSRAASFHNINERVVPLVVRGSDWAETNEWMFSVLLSDELAKQRDEILHGLAEKEILTRPFFEPMSTLPPFKDFAKGPDRPVTRDIAARGINLPSSYQLTDEEIRHVCEAIHHIILRL